MSKSLNVKLNGTKPGFVNIDFKCVIKVINEKKLKISNENKRRIREKLKSNTM